MCGIAYAHNFSGKPVNDLILNVFDAQRHRGTEGFGLFDGQELNMVHEAHEDKILNWLVKYDSNLLMFHHRFPTSTINVKRAAHPFSTRDYFGDNQYILVHNGIISNDFELFEEHGALGIEYQSLLQDTTFNDSEALLWDFALYMEGKQKQLKATGGIAFVCIKLHKGKLKSLYFGRNTSPLNMYRGKHGILLSSEGEGEPIDTDTLYTWDYNTKHLYHRTLKIPTYIPVHQPYVYTGGYAGGAYRGGRDWDYTPGSYAATNKFDDGYEPSCDDCYRTGYPCPDHDLYEDDFTYDADTGEPGDWLPEKTRRKFLGYKETKTGLYVPKTAEEREVEYLGSLAPSEQLTHETVMRYLGAHHGHFEQAYWAMEMDYDDLSFETKKDTSDITKEKMLLESCLEYLSNDPEYTDKESVSSLWEALWQQKSLV